MERFKQADYFCADDIAITSFSQNSQMTYGELATEVVRVHQFLNSYNIKKGEAVVLINDASTEWVTSLAGVVTFGAKAVVVPSGMSESEMEEVRRASSARLVFDDSTRQSVASTGICRRIDLDIFAFRPTDAIIVDYTRGPLGHLSATTTRVDDFMQIADG